MENAYILGGLRSYVGVVNGIYRHIPAEVLGAEVLKQVMEKYQLREPDYIVAGNGVGASGNIARLMALTAGVDISVPAFTVDVQCGSGLESIAIAAAKINSGEADVIIAGGFESSSTQPRRGYNPNHPDYAGDTWYSVAKFMPGIHRETVMLEGAELAAKREGITKEEMDSWVLRSHALATQAREQGLLQNIIAPAVFIYESSIARQLISFLAYSGTKTVPVIATEVSKNQQFCCDDIPQAACMGVMTSGSTGKSKLLWRSYHSWADFFPEQNRVFGVDEQTVIFCQGSLAFTGNLNIYMGVLATGGTLAVTQRFRPRHWLQLMQRYAVNAIYLIPSKLLLLPKFLREPDVRVRSIISGSQSMGRQEADKLLQVFPNADITLYYGASELNYITYIKAEEMTDDRTLIGRPFKGVQVSVCNEEIFIDTPYHVEKISLPFSLKDRGHLDAEGRLHFLGRTDDIVSVNGRKVSAVRVCAALTELQGVEEAAVICRHVDDVDVLIAFVGAAREYGKQELVKLLRQTLEDYELPKQFVFMEQLPHNESGKVDKLALKKCT